MKKKENGTATIALLEQHLYGSSRLGIRDVKTAKKEYELTNHLGNVLAVVSDVKKSNGDANVLSYSDYYPFGSSIPGRSSKSGDYRYGFTGHEKDDDISGDGNTYFTQYRLYDARLGVWKSIDPLSEKYPEISPYAYAENDPNNNIDPDGRWVWAAVGAALDYGLQVYDNYKSGKDGYDAWIGDVDFVDVALSAVNPTGKLKVVKVLVVEGTKAAVNISANSGMKVETDVKKVATDAVVNTAVSVGTGKLTDASSTKAVQNAKKEVATANKQLKTAERQAQRSPNSTKKAENVNTAKSNVQTARNKEVGTKMLNSTVGKVPAEAVEQVTTKTNERIRKENEKR